MTPPKSQMTARISDRMIPMDTVNNFAPSPAIAFKATEMRLCLTGRQFTVVAADFTVEQQAEAIDNPFGFDKRSRNPVKPLVMFVAQSLQPRVEAGERLTVGWADD